MTEEEIAQEAATDAERCVRESAAIDYAWQVGKLDEWLEKKFQSFDERTDSQA